MISATRRGLQIWLATIAMTTVLVLIVGGTTRLTHSGLSIVDWQPLMGVIPPLSQSDWAESFERYQQFPEYRQLRPHMTLAEYKHIFFWEYLHRLLARLIGLIFLVPFACFYFAGALTRPMTHRLLALFVLGSMQGIAGWLMVRSGLIDRPSVSHYRLAVHLILALAIVGACAWLIRGLRIPTASAPVAALAKTRATRALLAVGLLLGLQITWGAFVAGLKAGYAFNTFPLMGGTLVPIEFFTLRPAVLNLIEHPFGVQWMHRVLGTILLAGACVLYLRVRHLKMDRTSQRSSVVLLCTIAAQYVLGVLTLVNVVPLGLALAHQVMAVAILIVWVSMLHHVRSLAAVAVPEVVRAASGSPVRTDRSPGPNQ